LWSISQDRIRYTVRSELQVQRVQFVVGHGRAFAGVTIHSPRSLVQQWLAAAQRSK
jgi:hypothetical protein